MTASCGLGVRQQGLASFATYGQMGDRTGIHHGIADRQNTDDFGQLHIVGIVLEFLTIVIGDLRFKI